MVNGEIEFKSLLIGLAELLRQNRPYPFPPLFQYGCNFLALTQKGAYPRTMHGIFTMFEKPVTTWYSSSLPEEFDSEAGLMYDGQLSEEASRYLFEDLLEDGQLSNTATSVLQQISVENHSFKKLIEQLQAIAQENPDDAQHEYVLLRSFLINHPYVTTDMLREQFSTTRCISPQQVGVLYDDCVPGKLYWNCTQCGPLIEKDGQLRGIRPVICNDHRPDLSNVQRIEWVRGLRRLRPGLHWRTCLPGISEMSVFKLIEQLHKQYPDQLCNFSLWPGIDRYDLQARFSDHTVWAVDIKDHQNPYSLAKHLGPLYREGALHYDEGFYVIPMRQIARQHNYLRIARAKADNLPSDLHLVSEDVFEERVVAKIEILQKGRA